MYRMRNDAAALAALNAAIAVAPATAELHYNRALTPWRLAPPHRAGASNAVDDRDRPWLHRSCALPSRRNSGRIWLASRYAGWMSLAGVGGGRSRGSIGYTDGSAAEPLVRSS